MEPAIHLGSAIIVAPVAAADLRVGDVVSLRAGDNNSLFTHRIVEVVDQPDGRWIRTKGDANSSPDPTPVHASAVEGRVQLAIPLAGYLIALLSIPTGVLFLIGLAATLLAAVWLLESLELDSLDRSRARDVATLGPRLGEPMSPTDGRPIDGSRGRLRSARPHDRGADRPVALDPRATGSMAGGGQRACRRPSGLTATTMPRRFMVLGLVAVLVGVTGATARPRSPS
jgi:signal peptidase I